MEEKIEELNEVEQLEEDKDKINKNPGIQESTIIEEKKEFNSNKEEVNQDKNIGSKIKKIINIFYTIIVVILSIAILGIIVHSYISVGNDINIIAVMISLGLLVILYIPYLINFMNSKIKKKSELSLVGTIAEIIILIGVIVLIKVIPIIYDTLYPPFQCGITEYSDCNR